MSCRAPSDGEEYWVNVETVGEARREGKLTAKVKRCRFLIV